MNLTINEIAERINNAIVAQLHCVSPLATVRPFGLSSLIRVKESETEDYFIPVLIHNDGECYDVFSDDDYSLGWYHRIISKSYKDGKSWGNLKETNETDEIMLVVWGFSNQLNLSELEIESTIIIPSFPEFSSPVSSNFDANAVVRGEVQGISYECPPEEFIFSVKYKVQNTFNRKCLKINC
jgi:hypothetical protein